MSQLEIIHLRSPDELLDTLGRRIRESVGEERKGVSRVTLYRRQGLGTDLAVHIQHGGEGSGPCDLALRLASSLRAYGLVEHTVWEESK